MAIATVYLVGIDELDRVPGYLDLGAVVVIAPDQGTLRGWQLEQGGINPTKSAEPVDGLVLDFPGRQVLVDGQPLSLSDLEFKVMAALLSRAGAAWSFRDLRRAGWGEGIDLPVDDASVRSLVQRLRVKLRALGAPLTIAAVRGYGFRAEPRSSPPGSVETQRRTA